MPVKAYALESLEKTMTKFSGPDCTRIQEKEEPASADKKIFRSGKKSRNHSSSKKNKKKGQVRKPTKTQAKSRPEKKKNAFQRLYAAIDLGTNNCRLLIAKPTKAGFAVVDSFSRVVRLGDGLAETGLIGDEARDRTIEALSICATKIRSRKVWMSRYVATETCRQAANTQEFVNEVYDKTGLALDVISCREEAELAALGCTALIDRTYSHTLVIDIGGGSTELVIINDKDDRLDWVSIPVGVTTLAWSMRSMSGLADLRRIMAPDLERLEAQSGLRSLLASNNLQVIGASGTTTALCSLHLGQKSYNRKQVDGFVAPAHVMRELSLKLIAMGLEEIKNIKTIGPERADLINAGCAILYTILDYWPIDQLCAADRGIREGVLRSMLRCVLPNHFTK